MLVWELVESLEGFYPEANWQRYAAQFYQNAAMCKAIHAQSYLPELEDHFECELDLSRCSGRPR
jgi:hypothetical protein